MNKPSENSDSKAARQFLEKSRDELDRLVEKRTLELTRANEQLTLAEEKWRSLAQNAPSIIMIVDPAGIIQFINRTINGFTIEKTIGKSIYDYIQPRFHNTVRQSLDQVFQTGETGFYEVIADTGDKRVVWFETHLGPVMSQGRVAAVTMVCADITRRKQSEAERACLIEIMETTSDVIATTTSDYRPAYVNRAGRKLFGWSVAGDISAMKTENAHPKWAMKIIAKQGVPTAIRDGIWMGETAVLDADGMEIPVSQIIMSHRSPDNEIEYFSTIIRDISKAKRTEAQLQKTRDELELRVAERTAELEKSRETYRCMVESIEDGYYEVDIAGNLTFFNSALCKMMGYSKQELLGMNTRDYTDKKTAKKVYIIFSTVYKTGKPAKLASYQIITKDSMTLDVEASASLIRDTKGNPIGFRGILRDVSERLAGEKERERLEKQLQMAQKLEAIGTLAGGIAHDFNNLLMGLQGNISLMLMDMNPKHRHYNRVRNIEKHIKDASGLTSQLLGFAKGGKYRIKTTDINKLVKKTASMFGRTKKEIKISYELSSLWPADVDKGQIEQVLLNLFVNAWQAMPGGGGLFVGTKDIALDENFTKSHGVKPGKYVKISVSDTGTGMSEATLQKVFDPFFTTKDMTRGTGLGLSSAYGIIVNHEGIINVHSVKGRGATFDVFLPASEKKVQAKEKAHKGVVFGNETVLWVDDESVIINTGRELLDTLGYKAILADAGSRAVEIYQKKYKKISLVILDMIMPDMNGGQVYDKLKQINPKVKVLLSSGYSLDGQAEKIMIRGCDAFIQKPFSLEQLSHKIREILDK